MSILWEVSLHLFLRYFLSSLAVHLAVLRPMLPMLVPLLLLPL